MDENYRFYTNLFGKILSTRFFRVDLSSHKNSYMLFRVAKVYSQENLMNILSHVSSMHGRSIFQAVHLTGSPKRNPDQMDSPQSVGGTLRNNPSMNVVVPAFKDCGLGPSVPPVVHLLGPEFKDLITSLLHATWDAKHSEMRTRKIAEDMNIAVQDP